MSLNGLDAPNVQEAYQSAITEAGGWFLLKYVSRDSVELLSRGKGGVHEARNAIAKYEDPSPLYGLLIYRRRKVLIKFIPEGTSRLLQARTAVHFTDVLEKYSPHETLLEITTADGLNDTALASSFPLHTASPSASQSRLHEISEDGEDHGPMRTLPFQQQAASGAMFGTQRYKLEKRVDQLMGPERPKWSDRPPPSIHVTGDTTSPLATSPMNSPITSPELGPQSRLPQSMARQDSEQRSSNSAPSVTEYTGSDVSAGNSDSGRSAGDASKTEEKPLPVPADKVLPDLPGQVPQEVEKALAEQEEHRSSFHETQPPRHRLSEQSREDIKPSEAAQWPTRSTSVEQRSVQQPSTSEKPSISERPKYDADEPFDLSYLEPKPKVKLGPRPVTTGERTKRTALASVSAVPANVRASQLRKEPVPRPKSQNPVAAPVMPISIPAPPPIPEAPTYNPRPLSRGSIKSIPTNRSSAMTPDKIRLMKAVELRKKQLRKSQSREQGPIPVPDEVPDVPKPANAEDDAPLATPASQYRSEDSRETKAQKADSGIEMGYDKHDHQQTERSQEASSDEPTPTGDDEPTPKREEAEAANTLQNENQTPRVRPAEPHYSVVNEPDTLRDLSERERLPEQPQEDSASGEPTLSNIDLVYPELGSPFKAVPTIVMADGTRPDTSGTEKAPQEPMSTWSADTTDQSGNDTDSSANYDLMSSPSRQNTDLARRRRGIVEPLGVNVPNSVATTPGTDTDLLADEALMDELEQASPQEAQHIEVSRTPTVQYFNRRPSATSLTSAQSGGSGSRQGSQAADSIPRLSLDRQRNSSSRASPELSARGSPAHSQSPPAVYRPTSPPGQDPMQGLRRNVSSGITKRIQALADISSRDSSRSPDEDRSRSAADAERGYFAQRQSAFRNVPRSRNSAFRQNKRMSNKVSATETEPAPNTTTTWNVQQEGPGTRNSVSVTARIVRTQSDNKQAEGAPAENGPLQHSDLVINHKRTTSTASQIYKPAPIAAVPYSDFKSSESTPLAGTPQPSTPTFTARASVETQRPLHSAGRSSMGRHREPSVDDFPPPPVQAPRTHSPVSRFSDDAPSPKENRASRFFKRMSGFGGSKRKSMAQGSTGTMSKTSSVIEPLPTSSGRNTAAAVIDRSDMPPPVVVGDLNVQFPDSLLWKRRWVEIDDGGNLVFSLPHAMDHQRATAGRKFHLSELRMPYAPDLDRQELPHSVTLEFVDGAVLQAACEDGMTHRHVLHILRQYHKLWVGGSA